MAHARQCVTGQTLNTNLAADSMVFVSPRLPMAARAKRLHVVKQLYKIVALAQSTDRRGMCWCRSRTLRPCGASRTRACCPALPSGSASAAARRACTSSATVALKRRCRNRPSTSKAHSLISSSQDWLVLVAYITALVSLWEHANSRWHSSSLERGYAQVMSCKITELAGEITVVYCVFRVGWTRCSCWDTWHRITGWVRLTRHSRRQRSGRGPHRGGRD